MLLSWPKLIYLFWGQPRWNPGVPLPEGAVLWDLSTGVIVPLPPQSVSDVDKVFVVNVMTFPWTFAYFASVSVKKTLKTCSVSAKKHLKNTLKTWTQYSDLSTNMINILVNRNYGYDVDDNPPPPWNWEWLLSIQSGL